MKRLSFMVLIVMASVFCFSTSLHAVNAEVSSDSLIMALVANHDRNRIDIDVNMVKNTGVSGMTLELDYSKDVFEFIGYEKGAALDKLDLMSTNLDDDNSLPVKFNWFGNSGEIKNDESVGTVLKLGFVLKQGVKSGKYSIGFKHNDGDIVYVENGNAVSKNALISKVLIGVAENAISETEIIDEANQSGMSGWLIAGIAASSAAVVMFAVLLAVKIFRNKRGKGNWSKI